MQTKQNKKKNKKKTYRYSNQATIKQRGKKDNPILKLSNHDHCGTTVEAFENITVLSIFVFH